MTSNRKTSIARAQFYLASFHNCMYDCSFSLVLSHQDIDRKKLSTQYKTKRQRSDIYNTYIYTHSIFKILNFFNGAPLNITVFTNIQKAHIKRSMYTRVTIFSRLHFTTCFTISSWQKCHYYISTFLIKTVFHSQKLMQIMRGSRHFFSGGGQGIIVLVGQWKGGGGSQGPISLIILNVNLFNLKFPPPLFRSAHEEFHNNDCQIEKTQ